MELISQTILNPYRIYVVSKRTNKGTATFPSKNVQSYLDYTVDFSKRLEDGERILTGSVTFNGRGLNVEAVVCNGSYLTAFIDGGSSNKTYYLNYEAQTNLGGSFSQGMVLAITGSGEVQKDNYSFLALTENTKPPDKTPPPNSIKINNRYLLSDSGFFMVI